LPIELFDCIFANLENFISNPGKSCYVFIFHSYNQSIFACLLYKIQQKYFLFYKFEFSQKFSVKSQIFLHIEIVPIRYEWGEVKKVPGNKILYRSILEQCVILTLCMKWIFSSGEFSAAFQTKTSEFVCGRITTMFRYSSSYCISLSG